MPSFILINPTVWPQYTNVKDRTDRQGNGPIGQGEPFLGDRLQNGSPYPIGPLDVCPVPSVCNVRWCIMAKRLDGSR